MVPSSCFLPALSASRNAARWGSSMARSAWVHIARNEYDSNGKVTGVEYIAVNAGPQTASGGYSFDIVLFQVLEVCI